MRMYADHIVFFPLTRYGYHRHLHSFPTRRSSDLSERSTRPARSAVPVRPEARRDNSRSRRWCLLARREQHQRCPVDRKSTRLNSSHVKISYAVFCLKKKKKKKHVKIQPHYTVATH